MKILVIGEMDLLDKKFQKTLSENGHKVANLIKKKVK